MLLSIIPQWLKAQHTVQYRPLEAESTAQYLLLVADNSSRCSALPLVAENQTQLLLRDRPVCPLKS